MKRSMMLTMMGLMVMGCVLCGMASAQETQPGPSSPPAPVAAETPAQTPAQAPASPAPRVEASTAPKVEGNVSLQVDRSSLDNGGIVTITGKAPAGKPVYIEVWGDKQVRASRFDSEPDKETGKIPYILYMTENMPSYYKIFVPREQQPALEKIQKDGSKWSYSQALKDTGAEVAFTVPGKAKIDRYQATLMGSVVGSRGDLLSVMDEKENKRRAMQLVKARFRSIGKVFGATVEVKPDGSFTSKLTVESGAAPGNYTIVAYVDKSVKSQPVTVENKISFPYLYFSNAGTSLNLFWPFLLTLGIAIFGVLMGAGGGFILNPLLVSLWPLPHTVVAGTVMPTVLFSQASGILNYSKIKFINWKLGVSIGLAMVVGGFIGPKLTEMITLDQYKFVFGWILLILAVLMLWQTTPGYLAKHKKEQAILNEFKKKAEAAAAKE